MDINDLQQEIKSLLKIVGWSQKKLARELYMDEFEDDDEVEIKRREEKLKKALSRTTTQIELLSSYLCFIKNHNAFIKKRFISNVYYPSDVLNKEQISGLKSFSEMIDMKLE